MEKVILRNKLKIVSGGQTGADRAGLDVAINHRIPHGGWCPRGRWAEDGPLDPRYKLLETEARRVIVRTRQNVIDSDATLVFAFGPPVGGSRATLSFASQCKRPYLHVDLNDRDDCANARRISRWLADIVEERFGSEPDTELFVLNVAGSRESTAPGIYERVYNILANFFHEFTY